MESWCPTNPRRRTNNCAGWVLDFVSDTRPFATKHMTSIIKPNDRHDTSIENVLDMLRPILRELNLVGTTMPAKELARICRNRKSRLPLRNYNGVQMADQISHAAGAGSMQIGDIEVMAIMEIDPCTQRRSPLISIEGAEGAVETVSPTK